MSNPLIVKNTITINASPAKVWNTLTKPEETKKYMFGCETVSDWEQGSPLLWKGNFNGQEMVAVKGTIVNIEPGKFLEYTTIDPNSGIADVPENYLTVTYELTPHNGETLLTVTQGDYQQSRRWRQTLQRSGFCRRLATNFGGDQESGREGIVNEL